MSILNLSREGLGEKVMKTRLKRLMTGLLFVTGLVVLAGPAVAQDRPIAQEFDLGQTMIVQARFPEDSRFRDMPVPVRGLIAVPEGDGPFPVAVIVHGAYVFCTAELINGVDPFPCPPDHDLQQYRGFAYLAEALAESGYLTIVPDVAYEYNNGFGEPTYGERTRQMLAAHLAGLESGEGYPVDVAGKADLSRLVLAGHSNGGPMAMIYNDLRIEQGEEPADAIALFMPAAWWNLLPNDIPLAILTATCDGDLGTRDSEFWFEQIDLLRPALLTLDTLEGFTHNAISPQLRADPFQHCAPEELVDTQVQRDWFARFLPDFFDLALDTAR
jgi:dienelactone hydrolase